MNKFSKKILVVCGPTATGKTSLGISLARMFNGEIISADSRQVYKGMDIATGKDLPKGAKLIYYEKPGLGYYEFEGIPVWLLDVVKPTQEFSVASYVDFAWKVIEDLWEREKLPIVVGGTGFYIKGLIDGIDTLGVPPNWGLRQELEKIPTEKLYEMLSRIDPEKAAQMNTSDRQNPRRLIRAIELGNDPKLKGEIKKRSSKNLDVLFIGLKASFEELYRRIDQRVSEHLKKGAEKEIRGLLKEGYTWDLPAMTAMGYGLWRPYLEGKATLGEILEKWRFSEHDYARRQMTWFRKEKRINWFEITKKGFKEEIVTRVSQWYNAGKDAKKD